ncbi:MAG TPA: APC family permease [Gemmataceae bacterium]|nr:APC family permease [Gemmataceae bacterium]
MSDPAAAPQLRRSMGFFDLVLFVVLTSFGIMWFAKAGEAGAVGVTLWIVAGLVFYLPLALCVIVLSARYPGEGGLYCWSQRSFGDFAGFITGWTYWACILPFLPGVLYFIAGSALFLGGDRWMGLIKDPAYFITVSLLCFALTTALNIIGLNVGKWLHNAGALGTWLPALGLMALGFISWARHGSVTDLSAERFMPAFNLKEAALWPILVMSLTGLEAASILGDEIKDTQRRLPIALVFAAILVIVTMVAGTLAVLAAPPTVEQEGAPAFMGAFENVSSRAGVGGLLPIVAVLVVVGHLGKVSAWSATAARLPLVAGVDKKLPAVFARLHPRWGTPYVALLVQAVIVAVLIVIGAAGTSTEGAYNLFLDLTAVLTLVPFLFLFAAAIKVQCGESGPGRMQTPLGRGVAALLLVVGLATTAVSMILAVIPPEQEEYKALHVAKVAGLSGLVVGCGVAIYFLGRKR